MHKVYTKREIPSGFWEVRDLSFLNTSKYIPQTEEEIGPLISAAIQGILPTLEASSGKNNHPL